MIVSMKKQTCVKKEILADTLNTQTLNIIFGVL